MRLCHLLDVPDGGALGLDPQATGRTTVFVVRRGTQVRAWVDACPHHGTPLPWRKNAYLDASGVHVVCAAHGALFDPMTGLCILGPCLGDTLKAVALAIDSDGSLHSAAHNNSTETFS
ncbi:MAG: Rieske (2Fe-2S) protein [Curvibacter sp.]|nr:Rieske (2Fe-2S) protein [Curvibacter sp.]